MKGINVRAGWLGGYVINVNVEDFTASMKGKIFCPVVAGMAVLLLTEMFMVVVSNAASVKADDAARLVEDFPTVQAYTDEDVANDDIQRILNAGINTPSAMNRQPWHFSVVTDPAVLELIASEGDMSSYDRAGITEIPLAIVISCENDSRFDAGLAVQAMSIEAQLLGYGSKIFTSVRQTLNGAMEDQFREILQIPEGMSAMAVLSIGKEDPEPDAVSSPTGRYPVENMVTIIK